MSRMSRPVKATPLCASLDLENNEVRNLYDRLPFRSTVLTSIVTVCNRFSFGLRLVDYLLVENSGS